MLAFLQELEEIIHGCWMKNIRVPEEKIYGCWRKNIQVLQENIGSRQIGPLADLVANWVPHFLVLWQIDP